MNIELIILFIVQASFILMLIALYFLTSYERKMLDIELRVIDIEIESLCRMKETLDKYNDLLQKERTIKTE